MSDASETEKPRTGWLARLRAGLSRSSNRLVGGIGDAFVRRRLDDDTLEELEELLIGADLGPTTAAKLTQELARTRFGKAVTSEEVREALAEEIAVMLAPVAKPLTFDPALKPSVVLVVGVNGSGKTTTIGKLAQQIRHGGKRIILAAGDTFRAAAISQLQVWGQRADCPVLYRDQGADAAALAFDAMTLAKAQGSDLLMIDTAGRLQNKANLMEELAKIVRVLRKHDATAPHHVLLVLDATTGQNAITQVEVFKQMVSVTGLILTKLDGSARGGVLVGLAERFGLPVHAIGVGESIDDLQPFEAETFARALMGLAPR